MKYFLLGTILFSTLIFAPSPAAAVTYQETVEKVNYFHSVHLSGDQPMYAPKDIGSKNPTLQVYIWADLHNVYSQEFLSSTFPTLLQKYGDVARFSYNHISFTYENPTLLSGIMGECAAFQGFFWENVPVIMNASNGRALGSMIGVNQATFNECVASPKIKQIVETSNKDAESSGIKGIPTIVIENLKEPSQYDLKINGNQSLEIFDQAFQEALNGEQTTNKEVEDIKQQIVDLETAIQNTQAKVEVVEAEQSRLSKEVDRLMKLVQSIISRFRSLLGGNS